MNWTENAILYCDSKNVGKCPKCNSDKIEVTEHKFEHRKSLTLECKDCGAFAHFDQIKEVY